jgi:pimeloyl-ACP methyl ester carboxylesterase
MNPTLHTIVSARPNSESTSQKRTITGRFGKIDYTLYPQDQTKPKSSVAVFGVPGWSMGQESVAPVVRRLQEQRNYLGVTIQNLGLGKTELGDTDHTNYVTRAAENVLLVLAQVQSEFGVSAVMGLGHSMGSMIAALVMDKLTAENNSMKPITAVLITPVPKDPVAILAKGVLATITKIGVCAVSGLIKLFGDKMSKPIDYVVRCLMRATHALGYVQLLTASQEAQIAHRNFWYHLYCVPMRVVTIGMEGMRRAGAQTAAALARLVERVPVLVIQATRDTLVNPAVGEIIKTDAGTNDGNVIVTTLETGHFPIQEALDQVMEKIDILLDRLPKN